MADRKKRFPSFLEEMIKRMRREMERGMSYFEEGPFSESRWDPFESMMERFEKETPEDLKDFVTEEETPQGKVRKFGPFVYGFSYSKKPGEEPEIQEFGNIRPGREGTVEPAPEGKREPLTELVDLNGKFEITVELPGATKDEIDVTTTEETMNIKTTGDRKYQKKISFDEPINPNKVDANFKHGILTIEVDKKEEEEEEGKQIDIK